jgi:TolB protein
MNTDGGEVEQLTDDPGMDWLPAWSPSGEEIAFVSNRDGNWDVYVVGTGGGIPTNATNTPGTDTEPVWSPSGERILFASDRGGDLELFIVSVDGGSAERLGQSGLPFSWVSP